MSESHSTTTHEHHEAQPPARPQGGGETLDRERAIRGVRLMIELLMAARERARAAQRQEAGDD